MADYNAKIKELEQEISKTKVNKKTEGAVGLLKAKLAQLKEKSELRSKKKTGQSEYGYSVRKSGDATVILLGFPSAGKSTLLNKLTGTDSEVGNYAFTTLTVIPGMLRYKKANIQILDVPGIVSGAASGRGRGREVLSIMGSADLILVLVDVNHPSHYNAIMKEIHEAHIRMNKVKPELYITKKSKDGINIGKTVPINIDNDTIKAILRTYKIVNADVLIRSKVDVDGLIDAIEGNKRYIKGLVCLTKTDTVSKERVEEVKKKLNADVTISAIKEENIADLKETIFKKLDLIRVYLKEPNKEADLKEPLIIKRDSTIGDVCHKLHQDFIKKFKFARIWGKSAKFPGQRLMLTHVLKDKDILELHID
jgi:uncharacterized protein